MELYLSTWRKTFDIRGRARRLEYWLFHLIWFLFTVAIGMLGGIAFAYELATPYSILIGVGGLTGIWYIATLVPSFSVTVRRFHDAGISGKWLVAYYLVWMAVYLFILLATAGDLEQAAACVDILTPWANLALFLMGLVFLVVLLLPSKREENRWGPNPKQKTGASVGSHAEKLDGPGSYEACTGSKTSPEPIDCARQD